MPTTDQAIAIALLTKVMNREPLTLQDVERWGQIITIPINISSPTIEDVEKVKFAMRNALKQVYFSDQK